MRKDENDKERIFLFLLLVSFLNKKERAKIGQEEEKEMKKKKEGEKGGRPERIQDEEEKAREKNAET